MISVIMTTFNWENFIKDTIISILNQTYTNFEFIIVNDNSNDNTENIINDFLKIDKRIKYIKNKKNLWAAEWRNIWIKLSKWDYIAIIDDDDLWDKNKLEKQINFINNYKNFINIVWVIWTNWYEIDKEWKIIWEINNKITDKEIKNNILVYNQFIHSSVIYNKSILDKIYKERWCYFLKNNLTEDHELILKIWINNKLLNLDEKLTYYRVHNNWISKLNNILLYKEKLKLTFRYSKYYKWFFKWILATLYPLTKEKIKKMILKNNK